MCTPFQLSCRNNQQHVGIVAFTFVYNTHTHTHKLRTNLDRLQEQITGQAVWHHCWMHVLFCVYYFTCYTSKDCFWLLTVQKCEILWLTSFAGIIKWQSCGQSKANCSMLLCMLLICTGYDCTYLLIGSISPPLSSCRTWFHRGKSISIYWIYIIILLCFSAMATVGIMMSTSVVIWTGLLRLWWRKWNQYQTRSLLKCWMDF